MNQMGGRLETGSAGGRQRGIAQNVALPDTKGMVHSGARRPALHAVQSSGRVLLVRRAQRSPATALPPVLPHVPAHHHRHSGRHAQQRHQAGHCCQRDGGVAGAAQAQAEGGAQREVAPALVQVAPLLARARLGRGGLVLARAVLLPDVGGAAQWRAARWGRTSCMLQSGQGATAGAAFATGHSSRRSSCSRCPDAHHGPPPPAPPRLTCAPRPPPGAAPPRARRAARPPAGRRSRNCRRWVWEVASGQSRRWR